METTKVGRFLQPDKKEECSEGLQKYCEDQVSMVKRPLGMQHL